MRSHTIQDIIGQPSTKEYIAYIEDNLTLKCPLTKVDLPCAEDIFGAKRRIVQGKNNKEEVIAVIVDSKDLPKEPTRATEADFMYINEIPFVITVSRGINFGAAEL